MEEKRKRGRPPLFGRRMTNSEVCRRYEAKRAEREARGEAPRQADRVRASRATFQLIWAVTHAWVERS